MNCKNCHIKNAKVDKVEKRSYFTSNAIAEALSVKKGEETTIIDDRIVLSPGNEYVDFALAVGKVADIYEDDADYEETVNYFKLFRDVGMTT